MARIALIHATPAAVEPTQSAFADTWPDPDLVNLLDDSLIRDRALSLGLTDSMYGRFDAMGQYAMSIGADGILFTCTAFGPAIERVARAVPVPVLKPNEAMLAEAVAIGGRIGMLATTGASIPSTTAEFAAAAANSGAAVTLESVFVPHAMAALLAGKREHHDALIEQAAPALAHCDAIMLAQFSMAPAADRLRQRMPGVPILTSPGSAVTAMKARIEAPETS